MRFCSASGNEGLKNGNARLAEDDLDMVVLGTLSRRDKIKLIGKELLNRLATHNDLIEDWSENLQWLWANCQPAGNDSFLAGWKSLLEEVKKVKKGRDGDLLAEEVDDTLEEAVLGEVVDDGEEAAEAAEGSNVSEGEGDDEVIA